MLHKMIAAAFFAAALVAGGMAHAQQYPSKTLKWVVPFAAGGPLDVVARLIAAPLAEALGQPVIIENRSGANGTIGTEAVARSPADGYTLLTGSNATITINPVIYPTQTNIIQELAPVTQFTESTYVLVISSAFPAGDLGEFIAEIRKRPGKYSYASYGSGSLPNLAMEWLKQLAGLDIVHVPYKGGAPAMSALRGRHVAAMFDVTYTALPQLQSGQVRIIASGAFKRLPQMPDTPTIAETYPGFNATGWQGLFVPAGTPRAIVERLHAEVAKIINSSRIRQWFIDSGQQPVAVPPDQFATRVASDAAQFAQIVKNTGIRVE